MAGKSQCTGCGADIRWIKTVKGKSMPCNIEEVTIITKVGSIYRGFTPHWATCPKADEFRRREIANKTKG